MTRRHLSLALVAALALAGCGSKTMPGTGGNGAGGAGGTDGGGGSGGTGGSGDTGSLPPNVQIGTYIVLGDSISDQGGVAPYFYDSLHADLLAKFPGLMYVHAAKGGAISDEYSDNLPTPGSRPLLKTQIAGLANNYPGDILVTITIGGNDLVAHAASAIGGGDATARAELGMHLDAELAELAKPGRLGSGKVYLVLSNIYDFSDGMGDFATLKCPPYANVSAMNVAMTFSGWNGVMSDSIKKGSAVLYDLHADFQGHGFNNMAVDEVWYSSDCIHPNATGHDHIRRSLYKVVTGQALP